MQHELTRQFSDTQIRSIWRNARFGGRTRCIRCGWTRKFWNLDDGRWQCTRCDKKFGWMTDTPISGFRLSLRDILELLWWFELGLTDHAIAARLGADYHQIHRFFGKVRQYLQWFEDSHIQILDSHAKIKKIYFCPAYKNRRHKKRQRLLKAGKVKPILEDKPLQQTIFIIYQIEEGLVYVNPVADKISKAIVQDIIKEEVTIEKIVYSDEKTSYEKFKTDSDLQLKTTVDIQESFGTSGIESFWTYAKERLLRYHGVSPSSLLYYIKEIEFRFNHRGLTQEQFVNHLLFVLIGNHSYKC